MKKLLLISIVICVFGAEAGAQRYYDSLHQALRRTGEDTNRVKIFYLLATWFESTHHDSNYYYTQRTLNLSEKLDYLKGRFLAGVAQFFATNLTANYTHTLELALNNLHLAESMQDKYDRNYFVAFAQGQVGIVKSEMHDTIGRALRGQLINQLISEMNPLDGDFYTYFMGIANQCNQKGLEDSARYYYRKALELSKRASTIARFSSLCAAFYANYLLNNADYPTARIYFQEGLKLADYYNNVYIKTRIYKDLIHFFLKTGNADSAIYFGRLALDTATFYQFGDYAAMASDSIANFYERQHKPDSALRYLKITKAAKDSIFSEPQIVKFRAIVEENERKQREQEVARERFMNNIKFYASLAGVAIFLLISGILYRNNRQKQKANALLILQREEIERQRTKAEEALDELKTTQSQLIQREKMASLGELTAGIAHEIQNPLNFVNNFSEVNAELVDEMDMEMTAGNANQARAILSDLRLNLDKVINHGKRADAIVKGMLQHSLLSSGKREPTNLNELVNEYLRVSYHGQKAKDASFHVGIHSHFDSTIGNVDIVPQDIGRVLLNLFNNSFYAVREKMREYKENYKPTITVTTNKVLPTTGGAGSMAELRIRDNGSGIPNKIINKIFQPFYTSKPTGQGTGLGLSLAYDIVVKEHGGMITVDSREGEYAEFVIKLPIG